MKREQGLGLTLTSRITMFCDSNILCVEQVTLLPPTPAFWEPMILPFVILLTAVRSGR